MEEGLGEINKPKKIVCVVWMFLSYESVAVWQIPADANVPYAIFYIFTRQLQQ